MTYQRSLVKEEVIKEEVALGDSIGWMFDEDEEADEFGEELKGLLVYEEVEEFDPLGDIAYLEALLEGEPTKCLNLHQMKKFSVGILLKKWWKRKNTIAGMWY
ncbi:hypothetical protein Hdeb2414_s0019g00550521 [Helianthus debilis subsp. tardiflorus]